MKDKRRYAAALVWAVLAVLSAAAIVRLSGQDSERSHALSRGLAAWVLELLPVEGTAEGLERMNFILRKLAHFGLYLLLGAGLTGLARRQEKVPAALAAVVLGAVFAVTDEIHQMSSQGRTPSGWDVALDTCGVIAGCLSFGLSNRLWKRRSAER